MLGQGIFCCYIRYSVNSICFVYCLYFTYLELRVSSSLIRLASPITRFFSLVLVAKLSLASVLVVSPVVSSLGSVASFSSALVIELSY